MPVTVRRLVENRSDDEEEVGFLLKLALTPEGTPFTESFTEPVKPPLGFTVIVSLPSLPRTMVSEVGLALRVNEGVGAGGVGGVGGVCIGEDDVVEENAPIPFGDPRPVGPS